MRLDKFLREKFGLRSRTYAENLIIKGQVRVNGKPATKPSAETDERDKVEIISDEDYASQGAYKLDKALRDFALDVNGLSCADIGCSNGGFTDCLLRRGAAYVLAVDVAECALPERLLRDRRVEFVRANAREFGVETPVDFVCSDVSFISLKHILPTVYSILKEGGFAVVLIKPQFELTRSALSKKGIVKSEKDRLDAVRLVKDYAAAAGFTVKGVSPAPEYYADKNKEYLLYLKK